MASHCKSCSMILTRDNWVPSLQRSNNRRCRTCYNAVERERYRSDPVKVISRTSAANARRRSARPASLMLAWAKSRARLLGLPFDLSESDIVIPERCPVFGTAFGEGDAAPSLDRIVPRLGYVQGNVAVVSKRANTLKGDATIEEFEALVRFLENHPIYK